MAAIAGSFASVYGIPIAHEIDLLNLVIARRVLGAPSLPAECGPATAAIAVRRGAFIVQAESMRRLLANLRGAHIVPPPAAQAHLDHLLMMPPGW